MTFRIDTTPPEDTTAFSMSVLNLRNVWSSPRYEGGPNVLQCVAVHVSQCEAAMSVLNLRNVWSSPRYETGPSWRHIRHRNERQMSHERKDSHKRKDTYMRDIWVTNETTHTTQKDKEMRVTNEKTYTTHKWKKDTEMRDIWVTNEKTHETHEWESTWERRMNENVKSYSLRLFAWMRM